MAGEIVTPEATPAIQPITAEDLEKYGKGVIEGVLKSLGLDKLDLKHKIHPFEEEQELLKQSPEYRIHSLLCGIKKKDMDIITKAIAGQNETTSNEGGYFVPDVIDNKIIRVIEESGTARQEMFTFPMGKAKKIVMPTLSQAVSIGWVDEGGVKPVSMAKFGTITLEAKQMAGITVLTNQLLEDANIKIGSFIVTLFGEAIAEEEDKQFWMGDGTIFTGVYNATGATTYTLENGKMNVTDLGYEDLINAKNAVPVTYLKKAKWYCHRSVLSQIEKMKDGAGQYIFNPALKTLLGYPLVVIETAPAFDGTDNNDKDKTMLLFGNMKMAMIGDKSGTQVKLTDVGTITIGQDTFDLFQTNQSAIRVERRVGFSAGYTKTWVKVNTAKV